MAKSKDLIPDFMLERPDDIFIFYMPLSLKPELEENIGNSYFNVVVKNMTTNEYQIVLMSPELFYSRYKLHRPYQLGKEVKKSKIKSDIVDKSFHIDTCLLQEKDNLVLGQFLDKDFIGRLLGWTHKNTDLAKKLTCCVFPLSDGSTLIIPHYAIAIYYFYRSSVLREASLQCKLDHLYYGYDCNTHDASIIIDRFVPEEDAPFIHRFLCQKDAQYAFDRLATYILSYIKKIKNSNSKQKIDSIPIKAMFPVQGEFIISTRVSTLELKGSIFQYVHEIMDDNSEIGFSRFTTYYKGRKVLTEIEDLDQLQSMPIEIPSCTTERLKSEHASKLFKNNSVIIRRKKKCSSLVSVEMKTEKLSDEEVTVKLKIIEEQISDEEVDQSLTDASGSIAKKTRKTRLSSKGEVFIKLSEPTNNFDEFNQYISFLQSKSFVKNLRVSETQIMKKIVKKDGKPNQKCLIRGRERQYITVVLEVKERHIGLLELENNGSASTWIISSAKALSEMVFEQFLRHHIDEDLSINAIKKKYDHNSEIKFKIKYHERAKNLSDEDKNRWLLGVLNKV